jgi:hypothetical protein
MSIIRCCFRLLARGIVSIGLAGCAGQMPSVAGFMHSPAATFSFTGWEPKEISKDKHSFEGPYHAEDFGTAGSMGVTFGDRWRLGGQVAMPASAALTGGYFGDHFGSMNWIGTSLSGLSGGTALIEHTTAGNWLRIGSFQYIARNEMLGQYSSYPTDFFPDPITEGSVGYFEAGAGLVLTMRKELWEIPKMSLEGKMGRDLTFGFTRYYVTVSMSLN